ncbi:MAG: tetratricopeptide repeat protein [Smithella sp.]
MNKTIIPILLVLTFICSCSQKNESASYWLDKEKTLWDGGKYTDPEKAIEYLNHALKLKQNDAELYNKRGLAYYDLGQYQRAIDDNTEAIRLRPYYFFAYNNRSVAYGKSGQYQLAIEDCNMVIRLKPYLAQSYINRGTVYLLQFNNKMGCSDYKKACDLGDCKTLKQAERKGFCR